MKNIIFRMKLLWNHEKQLLKVISICLGKQVELFWKVDNYLNFIVKHD